MNSKRGWECEVILNIKWIYIAVEAKINHNHQKTMRYDTSRMYKCLKGIMYGMAHGQFVCNEKTFPIKTDKDNDKLHSFINKHSLYIKCIN